MPYRYIFAIATEDSVYFYDTQNIRPFGYVTGIHYSNLSDLSWSSDGTALCITSIDGFCSFVYFKQSELGKIYNEPIEMHETKENVSDENANKINDESIVIINFYIINIYEKK